MSSSDATHRVKVRIKNLESEIRIGIHPHESEPQRILVSADIEGVYPAFPKSIEDCFDYDIVNNLVAAEWKTHPHKQLLESCANELIEYIFCSDKRVDFVRVSVVKPDIFFHAESVGVEIERTRAEFERFITSC